MRLSLMKKKEQIIEALCTKNYKDPDKIRGAIHIMHHGGICMKYVFAPRSIRAYTWKDGPGFVFVKAFPVWEVHRNLCGGK